jgi:hypothetical protein
MKREFIKSYLIKLTGLGILLGSLTFGYGQTQRDILEVIRSDLKADRKVIIAEEMSLTKKETDAFWPIYNSYRAEMEKGSDGIAELILEYADLYPEVPDEKAIEMLNRYTKIEDNLLKIKKKYLKKFAKVLPPAKLFRFAQLDNRLDLSTRVGIAVSIPVLPAGQSQPTADKH